MKFKYLYIVTVLIFFFCASNVYANNEDNEQIDVTNIENEVIQTSSDISKKPNLNSRSAIVIDRTTKTILYGKKETEKRKMASTTKIMTAIVVLENSNLSDTTYVSKKAAGTGGSRLGLKIDDKITINDLLYGLMLCSGNDAAVALAEHVGGSVEGFSILMNDKAKQLNLSNTNFVTPHGLDNDNHYTTAYELALLTDYALKNKTFSKIVGTKNYTVTINGYQKTLSNTNELLGNLNGVYGVKTGFTNGANRCLVTACKRDNLDIICVVLGADTKKFRTQDSIKLIEYAYNNYETINIKEIIDSKFKNWKSHNLSSFNVIKGISNNIDVTLSPLENDVIPVKKDNIKDIDININCNYTQNAPLYSNHVLGNLIVNINNKEVIKLNILNTIDIDKKNIFNYFKELSTNYIYYLESLFEKKLYSNSHQNS